MDTTNAAMLLKTLAALIAVAIGVDTMTAHQGHVCTVAAAVVAVSSVVLWLHSVDKFLKHKEMQK